MVCGLPINAVRHAPLFPSSDPAAMLEAARREGYEAGRADAEAEIVAWLRNSVRVREGIRASATSDKYTKGQQVGSPGIWELVADAVERGEHRGGGDAR